MRYDLCFKGGGAKGIAYAGAMRAFEDAGCSARRFVGTSAGAITACLLAAGCSAADLAESSRAKVRGRYEFASFMDVYRFPPGCNWLKRIVCLERRGGMFLGDAFERWLRRMLSAKDVRYPGCTLVEFAERSGSDLTMVAADATSRRALHLNARTAPDFPLVKAVRASMAIPGVFAEVEPEPWWGGYLGEPLDGHRLVDGGIVSNIPMRLLTSKDPMVRRIMGDEEPGAVPNIALVLDDSRAAPGLALPAPRKRLLRTPGRAADVVATMMEAHDRMSADSARDEICEIPVGGVGTTEFDMCERKRAALVRSGEAAMKEHLAGR